MATAVADEWRLSLRVEAAIIAASLIVSQSAAAVYEAIGRPQPEGVAVLGNLLVTFSVIAWFRTYSRLYSVPWVFDMATFLAPLWVVLVPYYVVKRERWRGVRRVVVFVLTYVAAAVASGIVAQAGLALIAPG